MVRKTLNIFLIKAIETIKENTKSTITNPNYISEGAKEEVNLPKNMIALLHFGRSGTGFLHSLIDNHSEVSTLPSIYFNHFFSISTWEDITKDGWDKMIDRFISNYEVFFDARVAKPSASAASYTNNGYQGVKDGMTRLGESGKDFLFIDKKLFKKELSELLSRYKEIDTLIFFKLIHIAYERVLNNKNKNTIFYHIHNPDDCGKLNFAGLANDTKWLLTIRDPVEGTESWVAREFSDNNYKDVYIKSIATLRTINHPLFDENNSIGVRLDDLKQKPKETIAALCDWMGIKEEDTLYEMTAQGKKWWGITLLHFYRPLVK